MRETLAAHTVDCVYCKSEMRVRVGSIADVERACDRCSARHIRLPGEALETWKQPERGRDLEIVPWASESGLHA